MSERHAPAFPHEAGPDTYKGMSKRELIAMHLMAGLLADPQVDNISRSATAAVKGADALLEALK